MASLQRSPVTQDAPTQRVAVTPLAAPHNTRPPAAQLADVATLLADDTRATVCVTLLDGRAWTAGELATATSVAASTMSEHLTRLIAGGLLIERRQGRHRYVALRGPAEAELIEHLLRFTEPRPEARTFRAVAASDALRRGRTCYDHLAGQLGVAATEAMVARRLLADDDGGLAVTDAGRTWFVEDLGADLAASPRSTRPLARSCLDWTERRTHLGGLAGAQLCTRLFERGWIRRAGTGRAVRTTSDGARALGDLLGLDLATTSFV